MRLAPLALLLALLLPACDHAPSDDGEDRDGAFAVHVTGESAYTGAPDLELDGRALFAAVQYVYAPDSTEDRMTIQLQSTGAEPYESVTLAFDGAGVPATGTYAADAPPEGAPGRVTATFGQNQTSPYFNEVFRGTAGTVTVTHADAGRIEGTVDFEAADAGRAVRVEGSFTARPGR